MYPRSRKKKEKLRNELVLALDDATLKRDSSSESFVTRSSLKTIWSSQNRLETFIDLMKPGFGRDYIPTVISEFIQTLSILVYIGWNEWPRFSQVFLDRVDDHGRRYHSDATIPTYSLAYLETESFLGRPWGRRFFENRYIFCPVILKEGENVTRSQDWRLPFINEREEIIGTGGYGKVTKVIIAREHFQLKSGHSLPEASYNNDIPVARKRFITRGDYHSEVRNLNLLSKSLAHHDRILSHLATVVVGNEFNILSPLANMDLEKFLKGAYLRQFTLPDLISEAARLAGALAFLHTGIQDQTSGLDCCHRDIKPANILVFYGENPTSSPVGQWKISDFGISNIAQPERKPSNATGVVDNFTHTVQITASDRFEGPYQPPEVCHEGKFGRRSDVWSFGCILTRILALGLEGSKGLTSLDDQRAKAADGINDHENDHFYRKSDAILNPHIETWLHRLPDQSWPYRKEFLHECRNILISMLAIEKDKRPTAQNVSHLLHGLSYLAFPIENDTPPSEQGTTNSSIDSISPSDISILRPSTSTGASQHITAGANKKTGMVTMQNGAADFEQRYKDDHPLIYAIRMGNIHMVAMLLDHPESQNLEAPDSHGHTPLRIATDAGNHEMVGLLLSHGAMVDGRSKKEITPLMMAARHGHKTIADTLLNRGADVLAYCSDGYTSLHYAAFMNNAGGDIVRLLLERGSINIPRSTNHETPLLTLTKNFHNNPWCWDKLDAMIEGGANVSMADSNGLTPLYFAVKEGQYMLARKLIQHRAQYGEHPIPSGLSSDMKNLIKGANILHSPRQSRDSLDSIISHPIRFFRN